MKNKSVIAVCPQSKMTILLNLIVLIPSIALTLLVILTEFTGVHIHQLVRIGFPLWLVLSIWGSINLLYASPTIWIHDDGITVKFLLRKIYVSWDEIVQVRQVGFMTDVFFQRLTIFNLLIGLSVLRPKPMIRFLFRRKNHKIFIKMVKENIPDKLK